LKRRSGGDVKRSNNFIVGLLTVVLVAGCGTDEGSNPSADLELEDMVGTWDATFFKYTSRTNPNVSVDVLAAGGVASMTVAPDGGFSVVVVNPGQPVDVISGSLDVVDGEILVHDAGANETLTFQASLTGGQLAMITNQATYDFVGNGDEVLAILETEWEPTSGTSMADLAGTWAATELLFISQPDEADTVDVIQEGGSLTFETDDDGSYGFSLALPGDLPALEFGTVFIDEGRLILIPDSPEDPIIFNFELVIDTLLLEGTGEYDFDENGTADSAIVEAELQRDGT
jgi:hypothetical protein